MPNDHLQYRSKVSYQSCLVSRESRVASLDFLERRDSRLSIRESRLTRITEAEILEYYQVSREKKTTEFLAHLSCDAFIRAIFKMRANSG